MSKLYGEWLSRYSYQSDKAAELISGEHIVVFEGEEGNAMGQSLPQADGSELTLRLQHDEENHILTGIWQERTSLKGAYRGAVFHGAVQFILNEMNTGADGKWVGFNSSHTKVKIGDWRIERKQTE